MGKNAKKRKAHAASAAAAAFNGGGDDDALGGLSAAAVASAVDTVSFLSARPELFATRPFKELRAALHHAAESDQPSEHRCLPHIRPVSFREQR